MVKSLNFSYKTHCSPSCHSIGNDILHEGDPLFLTIAICSVCGTFHVFSTSVNIFLVSAVDFGVYVMETSSTLWIHTCRTLFHHDWQLKVFSVCVPYPAPLPTASFDCLQSISQPSLGLSLKLNILWEVTWENKTYEGEIRITLCLQDPVWMWERLCWSNSTPLGARLMEHEFNLKERHLQNLKLAEGH